MYLAHKVNVLEDRTLIHFVFSLMQYLAATLYLLSLLAVIVDSQQGDYQKFLNHGFKSGQMSKELSKLKVDVLGKVLKKHVTQLRSGNQHDCELQGITPNKLQTKVLTFLSCHSQVSMDSLGPCGRFFEGENFNVHNLSLLFSQASRQTLCSW